MDLTWNSKPKEKGTATQEKSIRFMMQLNLAEYDNQITKVVDISVVTVTTMKNNVRY